MLLLLVSVVVVVVVVIIIKAQNQGTTENHIGHCKHISEITNIKVQKI